MDWQPIESAPRDGTDILCCCLYDVDGKTHHYIWADFFLDVYWQNWQREIRAPFPATHWGPLPEPPKEPSGDV